MAAGADDGAIGGPGGAEHAVLVSDHDFVYFLLGDGPEADGVVLAAGGYEVSGLGEADAVDLGGVA